MTHRFTSPFSRDLFALGCELSRVSQQAQLGESWGGDAGKWDFVTCPHCGRSVDGGSVITVNRKPVCENCTDGDNL